MNINLDLLPATSPVLKIYKAAIRSHPRQAGELTTNHPNVDIVFKVNGVELSVQAIGQILVAEEALARTEADAALVRLTTLERQVADSASTGVPVAAQVTVTPAAMSVMSDAELHAHLTQMYALENCYQMPVRFGEYILLGTTRYDQLVDGVHNLMSQALARCNDEQARYTDLVTQVLAAVRTRTPTQVPANMYASVTAVANLLGGRQ